MPAAVQKTECTFLPNTDRPWLVNDIFVFFQNLTNGCEKNLSEPARCERAEWGEYCPLSEPIRLQDL